MCCKIFLLSRRLTGTAGSSDFVTVIEQRTFDRRTNRHCINLGIVSDSIPEYNEVLSVSLETEDEDVAIPISTVNITILDDDGIYRTIYVVHMQITLRPCLILSHLVTSYMYILFFVDFSSLCCLPFLEITVYRPLVSSVTLPEDSANPHPLCFLTGPSERRYSVGLRFTDGTALGKSDVVHLT